MVAITREALDDVTAEAWDHYRLTWQVEAIEPVEVVVAAHVEDGVEIGEQRTTIGQVVMADRNIDFVVDGDRRVVQSRGRLAEQPEVFVAVARPPADDGRPRKPYYVLAEGVELPD